MPNNLKVNIDKCIINTLFIDTYVIQNIAKSLNKEILDSRYKILYDKLLTLVSAKKLICPNASQDEEFLRINRLNEICYDVLNKLSRGLSFYTYREIENYQYEISAKAYLDKSESISYSFNNIFNDNITDYIRSHYPIFIALEKTNYKSLFKEIENNDKIITEEWDKLRNKNKNTSIIFEKQLDREYNGDVESFIIKLREIIDERKMTDKAKIKINEFENLLSRTRQILDISKEGWNTNKFKNLLIFYKSEYYRTIPFVDIKCKTIAYYLTAKNLKKIKKSSKMDIEFSSAYIPFCHIAIIDAEMKDILEKLKIDKKYNTQIYSIKDFNKIIQYLEKL